MFAKLNEPWKQCDSYSLRFFYSAELLAHLSSTPVKGTRPKNCTEHVGLNALCGQNAGFVMLNMTIHVGVRNSELIARTY